MPWGEFATWTAQSVIVLIVIGGFVAAMKDILR